MDYRYVDQQAAHRAGSHDDQQALNHHQQHVQHLPPHFAHQHGLQPPSLPHQHMHHVPQPVFVAAPHGRDAYNNRRQSGQDLQSILEVAGLVPVRPSTQLPQHQHPQPDQPRQQPRGTESRPPPMQLLPDSQLLNSSSQRSYANVPSSIQQPPHPEYQREYGQRPETQTTQRQQDSSLLEMIEPPQQQPHRQQQQEQQQSDQPQSQSADEDGEEEIELPPATLILKEKQRPGPLPPNTPPKLPKGLSYIFASNDKKKVTGVQADKEVGKGTQFGPFKGSLVDEAAGCVEESSWELCLQGKILYYVDGKYRRNENWMLHVQCSRNIEEQNLEAVQLYGFIYFRTTKDIDPRSELRVFYCEEYASHVGFKTKLDNLNYKKESDNFQCRHCQCLYKSAKRMLRHIKLAHEQEDSGEIRPIFTWEIKKKVSEIRQPTRIQERNSDNRFICVTCGKDFPTRGRLAAHETFHDFAGGNFVCDYCAEACENAQMLTKHMLSHQKRPYKCTGCGKVYTTRTVLRRHEREIHGKNHNKYECDICDKEFEDKVAYDKHEMSHSEAKTNPPKSDQRLGTQQELVKGGEEEQVKNQEKSQDKVPVVDVNSTFPVDMLGKRISYFDRPRPYKCRYCGARFRQVNQRKYHEQESHEGKGTYQCPHCAQRFVTRCNLEAHLKKHNPTRPFQCELCPRSFASESALSNHQGEHTGLKPYKCTVCSRGFRTQKLMGKHRTRMHGKREKRFPCSFCEKRFMERSSWRNHERRHKGIRPYVCLVCGKGFSSKDSMAVHQRVHTGEMPFKCEKCGKQFRNNHNLTTHMTQHAGEGE